jgi:hypothetical protein
MTPMRRHGWLLAGLIVAGSAVGPVPTTSGAASPSAAVAVGTPSASAAVARPTHIVRGAGNIRPAVERYRGLLGPDNGGAPRGYAAGRREINWDGVPDEFARPNLLPAGFFNARVAPRARGAVLRTPGSGVAVSADRDNPAGAAVRFGDINPRYAGQFGSFSAERLFSPIGSNVVDLRFYVPGGATRGVVRGFGAVYTDIDRRENTAFEYFDARGRSLGEFAVPRRPSGLSFLGVVFRRPIVARVRIEYGNRPLGPNETRRYDVAVMDDFIYGEPQPIRR